MRQVKTTAGFIAITLAVCMVLPLLSPINASASIPARKTLRIGLNFGTGALPSSNLINAQGSGYEFGYYNSNLDFTPVASTAETHISVMVDRNAQWNPSGSFSGQYDLAGGDGLGQPAEGSLAVGLAHVAINGGRPDYAGAQADAAAYADGFVRYNVGAANPYIPMFGNFTSSAAAEAAKGGGTVNTGTATTITVTVLGSNRILFEFDNSADKSLVFGIRPLNHVKPVTYYRGEQYNGGFRYERRTPTALTVSNVVVLEDYVQGVIPYEMSASWPLEALKAQAICARTYGLSQLNKHHNEHGFDLCNTADCQVYRGRAAANDNSDTAVIQTTGQVVTYNGAMVATYYSSSHGGGSESNENVWGGTPLPHLRGVVDNFEDAVASSISQYNWTLSISQADITARVQSAGYPNASTITSLQVSQYSSTGNVISVVATDSNGRQYTFSRRAGLQALFGATALRSQRFNIGSVVWSTGETIYINEPSSPVSLPNYTVVTGTGTTTVKGNLTAIDGNGAIVPVMGGGSTASSGTSTGPTNGIFTLIGKGWGHSIGMSQWGAYSQAKNYGRTAEQIITHYFTGVAITQT